MVNSQDNLFETSLQIYHEQLFALSNQIEKMKLTSYPSNEIPEFIEELSSICKVLLDKFTSPNISEYSEIVFCRRVFGILESVVQRISQSNISNHPAELMIPAKELIIKFGDETLFFTNPIWNLNYAIGDLWTNSSRQIQKFLPELEFSPTKKIFIQFPLIHKDDVLLGCVMGHELGHYFDLHTHLNISNSLLPKLLMHQNIDNLKEYISIKYSIENLELSEKQLDNLKETILKDILGKKHLFNWLKEFVADIIGILIYGPASHFSGDSIFTFASLGEEGKLQDFYSPTHPRFSVRSTVRMRTFEKLNYKKNFDPEIQHFFDESKNKWEESEVLNFADFLDGSVSKKIDGVDKEILVYRFNLNNDSLNLIENVLVENLDHIIDFIKEKIPESIHYTVEEYKNFVPILSEKIANFIPPNEINRLPVDSISILNAGWRAHLIHHNTLKKFLSESEIEQDIKEVINNLVKKALTAAHIHRGWNNACSK